MKHVVAALLGAWLALTSGAVKAEVPAVPLAQACRQLPVTAACDLIAEAATMLRPSYAGDKEGAGEAAFRALGYEAEYMPARTTLHRPTTDVFLVSRPGSNRLFIVITGTESFADWISNARFPPYTGTYRDGQFYAPPGHGGFRGGLIDIVKKGILVENEFDDSPLNCARPAAGRSLLAEFLCRDGISSGRGPIETIIVGHSRGAGIGVMAAPAFAGYEIKRPSAGRAASVGPQRHWPLQLHAIIGFSPPYAVSRASDRELGLEVPSGIPDHEVILQQLRIPEKTFLFVNDRDIVPSLGFGQARHKGHLLRVTRDRRVIYEGVNWGGDEGLLEAHGSGGYCSDVLAALGHTASCDARE